MDTRTFFQRESARAKIQKRLYNGWCISRKLFGDKGCGDIYDFDSDNYRYLLDNTKSKEELVKGLQELSPLADDALQVAEDMSDEDFHEFKEALVRERRCREEGLESTMCDHYDALLMPELFLSAAMLAAEADTTIGVAAIRLLDADQHELPFEE